MPAGMKLSSHGGWRNPRGGRATSQHHVLAERQKEPALTGAHRAGCHLQIHGHSSKSGKVTGLHKTPGKSLQTELSKMKKGETGNNEKHSNT